MDITARSVQDLQRLEQRIATERDAVHRDRFRAVLLAINGHQTLEIGHMLDRSRSFVQRWAYAYRDGGIEAIKISKATGRPTTLLPDRWEDLGTRLDNGPTDDDNVCAFRGSDIQRILENEFGAKYTISGVYELLHRLGYSWLAPRPQHRHADPEAQEAFKESAPLL